MATLDTLAGIAPPAGSTRLTSPVQEISSWYESDNPGTKRNLALLLTHGRLAGTGTSVILPVDQGFEHGPARGFHVVQSTFNGRLIVIFSGGATKRERRGRVRRSPGDPGRWGLWLDYRA